MGKLLKPQPLTRAEKRAAALDGWVKRHVAESREAETTKRSRLKELRLAREALQKEPAASSEHAYCAPKPVVHELVPEEPRSDSGQTKKGDES